MFRLPAVAIVGARNASLAGIKMARMLAAELGREGYARRLRAGARHRHGRASRAAWRPARSRVLAGGLDRPYPPENIELAATRSPSAAAR